MANASSGRPCRLLSSSKHSAKASVASSTFCENWAESCADSVCSAANSACCSGGNSAPLSTKSRKSCASLVCCAALNRANSGDALIALKRSYSSISCPISVKNTVTSGISSLYTARSSGVSATEFKCATTPQIRPTFSVMSVRRSTVFSHVVVLWALIWAICSRASSMALRMAGAMSSVRIRSKCGSWPKFNKMLSLMAGFLLCGWIESKWGGWRGKQGRRRKKQTARPKFKVQAAFSCPHITKSH